MSILTDHFPCSVQEKQKNKPNVIIFLFSIHKTKHEVKTDVVVCFRHAKQLKPTLRSGCDIPYLFGAMHILLAKPRYQHSPSIKLSKAGYYVA